MGLHVREQLFVHALRGAAQRQLAQRPQVAGREVVLQRALGLLGDEDLPFLEPLDQIVRRQSTSSMASARSNTESGTVSPPDMGDLRDHVIEALDVLKLTVV